VAAKSASALQKAATAARPATCSTRTGVVVSEGEDTQGTERKKEEKILRARSRRGYTVRTSNYVATITRK
jgi:hypothetical protein